MILAAVMRPPAWSLFAPFALLACGSAIAPRQPDGSDCNYAHPDTACGPASYCDPGPYVTGRGYTRTHTWGFLNDKTHAVGTCRRKGAPGAPCDSSPACASERCVSRLGEPQGHCE